MSINKLCTWFDVETVILRKRFAGLWPEGMEGASVYPDGAEVRIRSLEDKKGISSTFQEWFGKKYDQKDMKIFLEAPVDQTRFFEVTFEVEADGKPFVPKVRPSFADFSLLSPPEEGDLPNFIQVSVPDAFPEESPPLFAFYSFKGGVGRTIHLISLIKALSEQDPPKQVLIVDADLEAPGLTWWGAHQLGTFDISFLDFLALTHYDDSRNHQVSLSIVEERLRQQPLIFKLEKATREHYFLPAFREIDQLLRMPLRPEHLTQEIGKEWIVADILSQLGKKLEVDAVVVDLRAGLSELASPLLFDPRVTRIMVTTTSGQSIEGTKLVLNQSKKIAYALKTKPPEYNSIATPTVIMSMIQEEISDSPAIDKIREEITELLLLGDKESTEQLLGKEILRESMFDQKLIHLENLETTLDKLRGTDVQTLMASLADEWLPPKQLAAEIFEKKEEEEHIRHLEILKQTGEEYEYAESGQGEKFLAIQALKSLAQKFRATAPVAVIMGSKGSGKTFMYVHLARLRTWGEFLKLFDLKGIAKGFIWPLIESVNLQDQATEIIRTCHEYTGKELPDIVFNSRRQSDIKDLIHSRLEAKETGETVWKNFWLRMMSDSMSCGEQEDPLAAMQDILQEKNEQILFQIDGLEDIFQNVDKDPVQQIAIRELCQGVTNTLRELPHNRIGLLIFIRKDLVRSAIKQNFGQFEALYKTFELRWNPEEALRLVAWLVSGAAQLGNYVRFDSVENAPRSQIEKALTRVWGLKLGKPTSREAYTANWVVAALSDFRGQLQARDVVRLIRFASEKALQQRQEYPGRLLPPFAIKNALDPCSEKKVEEIQDEVSSLKGIFAKLKRVPEEKRRIPFDREEFKLTAEEINQLENLGIVTKESGKYYMLEIFRRGLGFGYLDGARPKVLSLLKKSLKG
jgi:MinD-like ATPase involved in chromosome partitioning or flagellar assembly